MAELLLGCLQPAEGGHVAGGGIVELLQRGFGPADGLVRYLDQILVPLAADALVPGVLEAEHPALRPPLQRRRGCPSPTAGRPARRPSYNRFQLR